MIKGKNIILGVAGGIAAYKAADLASKLAQAGAKVNVIMTRNATEFVRPMTFEALTGNPVITEMFGSGAAPGIAHINLADSAEAVVIAPATANVIAKLASGIADDMLTSIVLATKAPVIVCPAMHNNMYVNPATQENMEKLKVRGVYIVPAAQGRLASGGFGYGRLPDTPEIIGHIQAVLGRDGDLKGKRVVVTAGGTQEAIDPVRYISNRSSGKMGYAVAEAARDRGAEVTLITAPAALPDPVGVDMVKVHGIVEMRKAVVKAVQNADILIMAAAGADFIPKTTAAQKIKKTDAGLTLELVKAPDILSEIKDGKFIKVGFKAETQQLVDNAREKLYKTNLDLIVANDVTKEGSGFGTDTNEVTIIHKDGLTEALPLMSKREVADQILDRVVAFIQKHKGETMSARIPQVDVINGSPQHRSAEIVVREGYLVRKYVHIPARVSRALLPEIGTSFSVALGHEHKIVPNRQKDGRIEIVLGKWLEDNHISVGDRLILTKMAPREYELSPKK